MTKVPPRRAPPSPRYRPRRTSRPRAESSAESHGPSGIVGGALGDAGNFGGECLVGLVGGELPEAVKRVPHVDEWRRDRHRAEPEPIWGPVVADHADRDQGLAYPPRVGVVQ